MFYSGGSSFRSCFRLRNRGIKQLFIRVPSQDSTSTFICDTDSEEISIEYEAGFYAGSPSSFSILNCGALKRVKIVSHGVLEISKVMRGIKNCQALTELTIEAEYYESRVEMEEVKLLSVLSCDGYKNLKVLRILKKGNEKDDIQSNALIQVPKDCVVLCNSSKVSSIIARG